MTSAGAPGHVGRNDPCPCGSGKRYKECHGSLGATSASTQADPQFLLQQALNAYQRQDHRAAAELSRKVVELQGNNVDAWHLLAVVDLDRADFASATASIDNAIAIQP